MFERAKRAIKGETDNTQLERAKRANKGEPDNRIRAIISSNSQEDSREFSEIMKILRNIQRFSRIPRSHENSREFSEILWNSQEFSGTLTN